ncbi:MAG: hypothetical protein KGY39_02475 [Anaerolineales bacterium]|nr:hypothetical protein [Anaerolineales bacterium]MBS3752385.1 hypothetical protein [Anaerolineales bacterium]
MKRKKKMIIGIVVLVIIILVGVGIWISRGVSVGESRLQVTREGPHFPVVSGFNLERQEFEFPRDFEGELNLVIVPFEMRQQEDVNTWVPTAQELERSFPEFVYYELPTIYKLPTLSRTFINEGMRAGIPDQKARERTITLYLDKEAFKEALGIESEEVIHLFLVNQEGDILWEGEGVYAEDKVEDLKSAVQGNLD